MAARIATRRSTSEVAPDWAWRRPEPWARQFDRSYQRLYTTAWMAQSRRPPWSSLSPMSARIWMTKVLRVLRSRRPPGAWAACPPRPPPHPPAARWWTSPKSVPNCARCYDESRPIRIWRLPPAPRAVRLTTSAEGGWPSSNWILEFWKLTLKILLCSTCIYYRIWYSISFGLNVFVCETMYFNKITFALDVKTLKLKSLLHQG